MKPWFLLALLPICSGASFANDADGDGIPDDVEAGLGSDPRSAETFATIWERPSGKGPGDPGRSPSRVSLANAGGNRFIWRIDFMAPYPTNSSLLLYLDADDNAATGRQPGHGCEFMLRCADGQPGVSAYTADGKTRVAPAPRVAVCGQAAFISYDADLAQRDGASAFRLSVLSETVQPHRGVTGTGYFEAKGPPIGERSKMKLDSEISESVGVGQTWGLDRIDALMEDPQNIPIPIRCCALDGFRFDRSEYRADNALRSPGTGTITAEVPPNANGKFHIGFIMRDEAGHEVVAIQVGNERRAVAVANLDDNNQHLFFTTEAVGLRAGDKIRLRALGTEGNYRTEDLVLLREKPDARPPLYEFREIATTENRLTWITSWAARCTVAYGDGKVIEEPLAANNHRVLLAGLKPGESTRCRISAETRDGKEVTSGRRECAWEEPAERPTPAAGRVSLRVEPPSGAGERLRDWPVTSGVPFARGTLGSDRHVRLLDSGGDVLPLQAKVTGRWPGGSVKWLLLDFRHSGATAEYTLEFGPGVTEPSSKAKPMAPPELGELVLVDAGGRTHAVRIDGLSPEEAGSLRQSFHAGAAIGDSGFSYEARAHTYPGLPWARVLLTFGHSASSNEFATVRSLAWRMPSLRGASRAVRQHTDDHFESSDGDGKRMPDSVGPIFLRDFWQNYPKDIDVGPTGATIWLMPSLKPDEYDWAKGKAEAHKLFYWFDAAATGGQASGYKMRQGMTKTHEVWLGLDGGSPPLDRPLFAVAPPSWYARSGALGEFAVADPARAVVRDYDKKVADTLDKYLANRERGREFGMFNFGDWWGERLINWGNIEYDTQHAFFLQFVRSGDIRFLRVGEEAETHNRDVDTVHAHASADRVGCVYAHCIGHVGDYLAKSPLPGPNQGTAGGHFTVSHTWCEGHMDHYFLTGDRRSFETGLKIADHYDTYRMINYDFTNCRDSGWHLILTMAAYRATGDPFYLNAARIIVARVLERQTPKAMFNTRGGGWRRMLVPGHCLCDPPHYGNAGFMVGVLLTGLKWYHLETGDPLVAKSIIMGANFLIDDMWCEDVRGFRYTSCPVSSKGPWSNFLLFDGIGYAYRLTQKDGHPDERLASHLRKGTDSAIEAMSGMGKSYSQFIRVAPHFVGLLADLREQAAASETAKGTEPTTGAQK